MRNFFSFFFLIITGMFFLFSCDVLTIGSSDDGNELSSKLIESLDSDPENFDACLQILDEYQDSLQNREFDSIVAKAVIEKISDMDIRYEIAGSNIKLVGPLRKCLIVNSAEISFEEHEDDFTERNLLKILSSNLYPLVEITINCAVVDRVPNDQYINSFEHEVSVKDGNNNSISDFGKFKLKEENISDYIGPNTGYEIDKNDEKEILLRYKLWDEREAADENKVITERTKKIFLALKSLKNIDNLKIELKLFEHEHESGGGGEVIHTGPRGGRYVIRNGGKQYVK